MKLLILSQYYWPESFRINDVAEALAARGHEVTVCTGLPNYPGGQLYPGYGLRGPWVERRHGVTIRRAPLLPRGGGGRLRLALNYASFAVLATLFGPWLARGAFDAILVFEPSPVTVGIPARFLRAWTSAPVAFWVQDLWPQSVSATGALRSRFLLSTIDRLTRWIYRGCDRILVQSEAFIEPIVAQGVPRARIDYLPNSAEPFYKRLSADDALKAGKEGLPAGFRVMFAGNLGVAQDLPTLLEAAERTRTETDLHWIVVGDGRMRAWLESEIARRRLGKTVHLLGHRPPESMPALFAQADLLLATLRREPIFAYTIPSKIQSYMACGRPVVAALEGEGARILRDAGAGWVVPPEDPEALADAVLAARRVTVDERTAMGDRAEAYFREHFDRDMLLARLEALLATAGEEPR